MTRERYEQFLCSPLGRWLEAHVAASPTQPASAAVGRFVALLSADITTRIAAREPVEDALELLDLVSYRLYGFAPQEVAIAEAYLAGDERDERVAGLLEVERNPDTL